MSDARARAEAVAEEIFPDPVDQGALQAEMERWNRVKVARAATIVASFAAQELRAAAEGADARTTEFDGEYGDGLKAGFEAIAEDLRARADALDGGAGDRGDGGEE